MSDNLKDCPFCGYDTVLETMQVRKGWEADAHCNGCLASIHTITYDTEQEAIDAATSDWNRRSNTQLVESGWIPINDHPPNENEDVLVKCKNGARFVAYRIKYNYSDDDVWNTRGPLGTGRRIATSRITHWHCLP